MLHLSQAIRLEAQGFTTATPCLNKSLTDCKDLVDQVVKFCVDMNLREQSYLIHCSFLAVAELTGVSHQLLHALMLLFWLKGFPCLLLASA